MRSRFAVEQPQRLARDTLGPAGDGLTRDEILSRNAKQFSEEKKIELADFIVRNDDTELVIPQVLKLHEGFLRAAR